jgi:hypothetical protein
LPSRDEIGERQFSPSVAARAVGVEPVAVLEQAGEDAEVDQGARVTSTEVHRGSGTTLSVVSGFLTWRGLAESPLWRSVTQVFDPIVSVVGW